MFGSVCIDIYARAHYLPCNLSNRINDVYYCSIAPLPEFSVDEFFVILACPPSNFVHILKNTLSRQSYTASTKLNSLYKAFHFNTITKESIDLCETRLKNIKYNKKKKYINLTQYFLTDPSFLFIAHSHIKSKLNETTRAVGFGILNKINSKWFINAAEKIKNNSYVFKASKRANVFKFNSSIPRRLIMSNSRDRIIQQAIHLLLCQVYEVSEKILFDFPRGSRPNRSVHAALQDIKKYWTTLYWFIETDIETAFNKHNRHVLMNLLGKTIADQRLSDLLRKMFNAGILAPANFYYPSMGAPQITALSTILSNIYFSEFDNFMQRLTEKYKKGKNPTRNEEYFKLFNISKYERTLDSILKKNIFCYRRKKLFNKGIKPFLHDGNFIRVKYTRYLDNILIGVRGPKIVVLQIKKEFQNWLKSNLHLSIKESETKVTYSIGNKIEFLGFSLFRRSYSQAPYRNSRRIEKRKRIMNRIQGYKDLTKRKLAKILRIRITKIIENKLGGTNKTEEKNHFTKELSENLIHIINKDSADANNLRGILRKLESNLADVIMDGTNKKIHMLFKNLFGSTFIKTVSAGMSNSTLATSFRLSESSLARKLTDILKVEGLEHYKQKRTSQIRFDNCVVKYLKTNKIRLTNFPANFFLDEQLKKKLIVLSNKPKKKAIAHNYKTLINHLWELHNNTFVEQQTMVKHSKASSCSIDDEVSSYVVLPIHIKVNWFTLNIQLRTRGFLNKKFRPGVVACFISSSVADIIQYFNQALHSYLSFFRCVDDFIYVRARLFWYFQMSLVSTLKAKFKLGGRNQVFKKYTTDLKCLNEKGNEIRFVKWEDVKNMKREFLVHKQVEKPENYMS